MHTHTHTLTHTHHMHTHVTHTAHTRHTRSDDVLSSERALLKRIVDAKCAQYMSSVRVSRLRRAALRMRRPAAALPISIWGPVGQHQSSARTRAHAPMHMPTCQRPPPPPPPPPPHTQDPLDLGEALWLSHWQPAAPWAAALARHSLLALAQMFSGGYFDASEERCAHVRDLYC